MMTPKVFVGDEPRYRKSGDVKVMSKTFKEQNIVDYTSTTGGISPTSDG